MKVYVLGSTQYGRDLVLYGVFTCPEEGSKEFDEAVEEWPNDDWHLVEVETDVLYERGIDL